MKQTTQYKNTPVGLIPVDWEVKKLGDIIKLGNGKDYKHLENGNVPVYGSGGIITYVNDFLFDGRTVGIGRKGSIDKPVLLEGKFWTVDTLFYIKEYYKADVDFVYNLFQSINWLQYSEATGLPSLSQTNILNIKFPLPPLPEQQKIAEILSNWDKALQETQTLIQKIEKRNKALAFSLLTGKKRVKGFEEKEFKKSFANQVFKSVSIKNNTENVELLSSTQEYGIIPRSLLETRVTMPSGSLNTYKLVQKGDFVISLRSFQGGIEYSEYTGVVSPAYTVLKPINKINDDYYKYYFKSRDLIGRLSVAVIGIRDGKNISYDDFSTITLPNPSLEEQTAIAAILNTAHQELKQYQEKLKALQQQKKGLMQQLLTGKVRTI